MKLRIKGNSIRLRLTRSEVAQFGETGQVAETIAFGLLPVHQLTYQLVHTADVRVLTAVFTANCISVQVPEALAKSWVGTDLVGFEADMPLSGNESLFILIEKDFACIDAHPREDQSDSYTNPILVC